MPDRSSGFKDDLARLLEGTTRGVRIEDIPKAPPSGEPEKNQAAVMLGRLGGLKGGPARAKALSKKRRSEIARKAAEARWNK